MDCVSFEAATRIKCLFRLFLTGIEMGNHTRRDESVDRVRLPTIRTGYDGLSIDESSPNMMLGLVSRLSDGN